MKVFRKSSKGSHSNKVVNSLIFIFCIVTLTTLSQASVPSSSINETEYIWMKLSTTYVGLPVWVKFDLFTNEMPKTVKNFASLCLGNITSKATTDISKSMTYQASKLFRIVKSYGIFGGDFIKNDGTSGESIYGMVYRDESYLIAHDARYLLTATKPGSTPHTSNSQFMITLSPLKWVDDRYQVFGRVNATSYELIDQIEKVAGTEAWDKKESPLQTITITGCRLDDPYSTTTPPPATTTKAPTTTPAPTTSHLRLLDSIEEYSEDSIIIITITPKPLPHPVVTMLESSVYEDI
eukprot:403344013